MLLQEQGGENHPDSKDTVGLTFDVNGIDVDGFAEKWKSKCGLLFLLGVLLLDAPCNARTEHYLIVMNGEALAYVLPPPCLQVVTKPLSIW